MLLYAPRSHALRAARCCGVPLVVVGAFAQLYVIIIGGQAFPLQIFPGYVVESSFFDGVVSALRASLARSGCSASAAWRLRLLAALLSLRGLDDLPEPLPAAKAIDAMASLLISAAHKSSGKTTLSLGLCAALARRGLGGAAVQEGSRLHRPDVAGAGRRPPLLQPGFLHRRGTTKPSTMFARRSRAADIALVEGNKGLYDGLASRRQQQQRGAGARRSAPRCVLVIDARGMTRGIAPLLLGYQMFDREVRIAGVIVNMTGGQRHESKLRAAVERYTDIPFLGALEKQSEFELTEKHLGLIPGYEDPLSQAKIAGLADAVGGNIDLDRLVELAAEAQLAPASTAPMPCKREFEGLRIGIVQDRAFGFYYPGDLEAIQESGAELVKIDAINDTRLPDIDGLFIGGGFPERHAAALERNAAMRNAVRHAIDSGLPTYAECGGIMYLSQAIRWQEQNFEMAGVIPAKSVMHERPQGRGYVKLVENDRHPWPYPRTIESVMHAHEFHYSALEGLPDTLPFAYRMTRGYGISGVDDGLVYNNLLASYTHLRNTAQTPWVRRFLGFVQTCRAPHLDNKLASGI